jgi:hypothetical protein
MGERALQMRRVVGAEVMSRIGLFGELPQTGDGTVKRTAVGVTAL